MDWRGLIQGVLCGLLGAVLAAAPPDAGQLPTTNHDAAAMGATPQNWAAVQDAQGVLYVGNTGGILSYDGQSWAKVPMARTFAVRALCKGPDGTIYYGSVGELGRLEAQVGGGLKAVSMVDRIPSGERSFTDVVQVESVRDGIYFLTHSRTFRLKDGVFTVLPGRAPRTQACTVEGTLFYSVEGRGLCAVSGNEVVPLPGMGAASVLAPLPGPALVAGQAPGRLVTVDLRLWWDGQAGHFDFTRPGRIQPKAFHTEVDAFLGEQQGHLFRVLPVGEHLGLLTLKAGLLLVDREGRFQRALNREAGLVDNAVISLLVDRNQDLWVLTNNGVSFVERSSPQTSFDARNGLQGAPLAVAFRDGRLHVGTFQGLYVLEPPRYGPGALVPQFRPLRPAVREIWQFLEAEGDLLAGASTGLAQIQGDVVHPVPGGPSLPCLSLATSKRWPGWVFAGFQGRMAVFRKVAGRWTFQGPVEGIAENVRRMAEDAQGDLWLSTDMRGVIRVHFRGADPRDVALRHYGTEQGLPELKSISARWVGPTLYAATQSGMFSCQPGPWREGGDDLRFQRDPAFARAYPDPATAFNDLMPVPGGFLVASSQGIDHVTVGSTGLQVDGRAFRGGVGAHTSAYGREDGTVWLPGQVLHRVDLAQAREWASSFPVLLRKALARGGRLVFEGAPHQGAVLGARENGLTLHYAAPSFSRPAFTRFQTLMEGLETEWTAWTSAASREFNHLPPGAYRFRVRARNVYGDLGAEAAFAFRVLPPWYRHPVAWTVWVLLGSGLLAGSVHLYTLELQRHRRKLQALVDARTAELRQVNERLYRLNDEKNRVIGVAAHDLRDPLSGILLACDLLDEPEPEDVPAMARTIREQGSRMMALIQGLLDVNAIEADAAETPHPVPTDPAPVVRAAARAHAARAASKRIVLDVHLESPRLVLADPRHLERVLENLVSNAVKYSPQGTRVRIDALEADAHTVFRVADQGPGLTAEDMGRLFRTYARLSARPTGGETSVGLGLSIVKKLVEGMHGEIWAESVPGHGATFCVKLPWA